MDVYQMTTKSEGMMIPGKLKWYAILALALWLAFSGVAAAEQLYVNESGWWRVDGAFNASGAPIQAAVDAADAGDAIYVWNGTYYEGGGVSITKERITLQGEDANTTTIHGKWTAEKVVQVTGNYVNVSGFTVAGSALYGSGIYVNADYCTISYNDASEMRYGIYLGSSSNCVLTNNTANSGYEGYGIYLGSSSNCVLTNNTASSGYEGYGIYLSSSSNCVLTNNTANSGYEGYGIYLSSSSNCVLTNNTASSNRYGIHLSSSSNCTLENNIASSNRDGGGIYLGSSSNCTLENNIADSNSWNGIRLRSSSNNTLTNNTANSNNLYGICIAYSSNCVLMNNTASSNRDYSGIYLYSSSNNTLTNNNCSNNKDNGIRLISTSINNNIKENTISGNTNYGMYLDWSGDNEIYHNNFVNNNKQAYDHNGFNSWDKGASVGGNYWSDHVCHGNPSNGTEPYRGIDTNADAVDTYPFEELDGWATVPPPFTAADAVIALQIAVGSRPPDLRWDVSGDGSVTSLDALMILQAAAMGVEIG